MKEFTCPHCGQSAFTTLCTDCQAEGIRIDETRAIFHIGRCRRCGHVDDEPCSARIGSNVVTARAGRKTRGALKDVTQMAFRLATRAAEAIRSGSIRAR
jgi:NMD protein affecting ribosome stability and mRNA decay